MFLFEVSLHSLFDEGHVCTLNPKAMSPTTSNIKHKAHVSYCPKGFREASKEIVTQLRVIGFSLITRFMYQPICTNRLIFGLSADFNHKTTVKPYLVATQTL